MSGLFAAGLILLALAAAAGSACLAVLGGFALAGREVQLDVAGWLGDPIPGQQAAGLAADRLSGMFLALTFGAAVPVSVAFASWARRAQSAPELCSGSPACPGSAPAASNSAVPPTGITLSVRESSGSRQAGPDTRCWHTAMPSPGAVLPRAMAAKLKF